MKNMFVDHVLYKHHGYIAAKCDKDVIPGLYPGVTFYTQNKLGNIDKGSPDSIFR